MKGLIVAAALAAAGCGFVSPGGDEPTAEPVAEKQAAPAEQADAGITRSRSLAGLSGIGKDPAEGAGFESGPGAAFPVAMLIGHWTDDGNCKLAADIRTDGAYVSWDGTEARWTLEGDQFTVTAGGASVAMRLRPIDANTIEATSADGTIGRSTRC